jgi:hypothetical protein
MLTKLEELLRECKNELVGAEYCNIEARLVEAKTLIRPNGDWFNFCSSVHYVEIEAINYRHGTFLSVFFTETGGLAEKAPGVVALLCMVLFYT